MNKIQDILKELGVSNETSSAVMEALEQYKTDVRSKLQAEFLEQKEKATKVCLEELENEKLELAKKVEIFLESRANAITREIQKQAAIGESKATKALRDVKNLLEGVNIGGQSTPEDLQAALAELKTLRVVARQLKENSGKWEIKAQRANAIAMKALERNKLLESFKKPTTSKPVAESRVATPTAKPQLGSLRKPGAQPSTTRQPLNEAVNRTPAKGVSQTADSDVLAIANKLDGDPIR